MEKLVMSRLSRSIDTKDYVFNIYVSLNDPSNEHSPFTAFVSINRKRLLTMVEVAGVNVRDSSGKRMLFDTIEDAFEAAEEFIKGFNIS